MATLMNRVSEARPACSVNLLIAEAEHHLMSARVSLERFAVSQDSSTHGQEFPQFEEAARAIHTALVALRGCSITD